MIHSISSLKFTSGFLKRKVRKVDFVGTNKVQQRENEDKFLRVHFLVPEMHFFHKGFDLTVVVIVCDHSNKKQRFNTKRARIPFLLERP